MAHFKAKTPTAPPPAADDGVPMVEMVAIHDYHYGGDKRAAPGTTFSVPLTEVDWLLENGVAKLAGQ